jgi:hypothetical protein
VQNIRRRLGLGRADADRGMAMAVVLIFGMLIMVLAATALTVAVGGLKKADTDQDWAGALSAAYAGVEDYQARLSNDTNYYRYGNKDAPFSATSPTLVAPTTVNPAFQLGTAAGSWAEVPSSGGTASYRYEVDSSAYLASGTMRIRSTGKVGAVTRSVVADVRQKGFIDYLYFTDYEDRDPEQTGTSPATCRKYVAQGRIKTNDCGELAFGSGDVLDGDVHSNDAIRICDAKFLKTVTTSNTALRDGVNYIKRNSNDVLCTGQDFPGSDTQPTFRSSIGMPATNLTQKRETRFDLPSEILSPGCLYTGPTSIVFGPTPGLMTIKSPLTKFTQTGGDNDTEGKTPDMCGKISDLKSAGGATVPVLDNNLIYVQDVPGATSNKNYTSTAQVPAGKCDANGVGYPRSGETAPAEDVTGDGACAYDARGGDVFVEGIFSGKMTVASKNYMYITGDVKYDNASTDILGLSPAGTAWIYNPMKKTVSGSIFNQTTTYTPVLPGSATSVRRVDAAIISVDHSLLVQNFDRGGRRGTLNLNGALAQRFRGVVSSGSNGYVKNYVYDARLKYLSPPKFISPVTTQYGVTTTTEVKAAFTSAGRAS